MKSQQKEDKFYLKKDSKLQWQIPSFDRFALKNALNAGAEGPDGFAQATS